MITHAQLLEIVRYCPATGIFALAKATARRPAGTILNKNIWQCRRKSSDPRRATYVSVPGFGNFRAGRLAWFYVTAEWPRDEVDHEDNDGWNQRWSNLRPATRSQNQANTRCYSSNKLGLKGVHFCEDKGRYRAMIQKDNRRISLGYFDTGGEAAAAYATAAAQHHGDFARL